MTGETPLFEHASTQGSLFGEAVAPATRIALWRCKTKGCPGVHAVELELMDAWVSVYGGGREERKVWRVNVDGRPVSPRDYVKGLCPECGRQRWDGGAVNGRTSDVHQCDSRCMYAKRADCECSCGGANHGRGWLA